MPSAFGPRAVRPDRRSRRTSQLTSSRRGNRRCTREPAPRDLFFEAVSDELRCDAEEAAPAMAEQTRGGERRVEARAAVAADRAIRRDQCWPLEVADQSVLGNQRSVVASACAYMLVRMGSRESHGF